MKVVGAGINCSFIYKSLFNRKTVLPLRPVPRLGVSTLAETEVIGNWVFPRI
jgi:hypothetical protein